MNKNLTIEQVFKLGVKNHQKGKTSIAQDLYIRILKINPNHSSALNNLGSIYAKLGEFIKAKKCYEKVIEINPNQADAYNNLGVTFRNLRKNHKAKKCFKKAIEINPNFAEPHNNLGVILQKFEPKQKAKSSFEKAIEINPNYSSAYWNLCGTALNIDEALSILKKLYKIDNKHTKAKILISALEGFKGNLNYFNEILTSPESNHPYTRSIKWIFSLPKLPDIFFNRFKFFDAVIKLADNSKPFYEFGVWSAVSFQYLINTFKKGFGFDTFTGLPEDWYDEPKGTYSASGKVPKIKGGEFIVGKFEDTLPIFFSKKRPIASLINFDADLYSSTLCALNYSNKVIDEKTILIFDEFLINDKWEQDEFKALNEFCNNLGFSYEVLAISFTTKQVAVKLKKN